MAPSSSADLSAAQQSQLLQLAREAIGYRLQTGKRFKPPAEPWPTSLRRDAACFVTLTIDDCLRGCVGSLDAGEPLYQAVAYYADSAACADKRFEPLAADELPRVAIEISVLSPKQRLSVSSESELSQYLAEHRQGLVLEEGARRATFLPQVWEKLPDPQQFVTQLKLKAGLSADYWSDSLNWSVYTVISFEE